MKRPGFSATAALSLGIFLLATLASYVQQIIHWRDASDAIYLVGLPLPFLLLGGFPSYHVLNINPLAVDLAISALVAYAVIRVQGRQPRHGPPSMPFPPA